MLNGKRKILIVIWICLSAITIAGEKNLTGPVNKERIIHFPKDRSIGQLKVKDAGIKRQIKSFHYWITEGNTKWELLGEATGDVVVPEGKLLALDVSQSGWRDLSCLSRLRPDELYKLSIPGPYPSGPMPGDSIMPHIAHLTGLRVFELGNTRISARGLRHLSQLNFLEQLYIKGLRDDGLAEIAVLSSLKRLYLKEHNLSNAGLAHLAKLASLEELELTIGPINDAALAHLAKLPSLQYLMLWGDNFTDAGMAHLRNVPSLRILHFGGLTKLTDKALIYLSQISNLECLNLHWNENITDAGIVHLTKLNSLKMLDIGHSKVTDEGLAQLAKVKSLEYLNLPDRCLNDTGLEHLAKLENLKHLNITRPHFVNPDMDKDYYTDEVVIKALSNLNLLEELLVGSIGLTDKSMPHIAKLKNLKSLSLFGCSITNNGLAELKALKSLKILNVSHGDVTISGLTRLSALPNLTNLHAHDIRRGNSALDVSGLTKLERLDLNFKHGSTDKFMDADLVCLRKLKSLEQLQLYPHKFTDAGMVYLAELTELWGLYIGGPDFNDDALRHLAGLTRLDHLTISDGNITDKGLRHLENLKALRCLEITSRRRFTPEAIHRLRRKLPNLTIFRVQIKDSSSNRAKQRR